MEIVLPTPFQISICASEQFTGPLKRPLPNQTDAYCLGLAAKGNVQLRWESRETSIEADNLWGTVLRPDTACLLCSSETAEGIFLILKGRDCEELVMRWGIRHGQYQTPARYPHRSGLLLEQLHRHYHRPRAQNPFFILTRLLRIAQYQFNTESLSSEERYQDIVNRMTESWKHNPALNTAQIAKRLQLSATTLRTICHRTLSMSPHDYLNRIRQDLAKEMLFKTKDKIAHISRAVGFDNDKYFVTWFKKLEGLTPTEWRKRFLRT